MTGQPLDPAAIMAAHGWEWCEGRKCCVRCQPAQRSETTAWPCEPYRLADALRDRERDLAAEGAKVFAAIEEEVLSVERMPAVWVAHFADALDRARAALVGEGAAEQCAVCSQPLSVNVHAGCGEGAADRGLCGTCLEPITATDEARQHDGEWMHVGCIGDCDCPECSGEGAADQPQGSRAPICGAFKGSLLCTLALHPTGQHDDGCGHKWWSPEADQPQPEPECRHGQPISSCFLDAPMRPRPGSSHR